MLRLETLVFDKRFFFNADISGRLQGTSNCLPFQRAIVSILYCYRDYTLVRFTPEYIDHVRYCFMAPLTAYSSRGPL